MRRTFLSTGSPQTEDERWYILQNWRNDPVVTLTDVGVQIERVRFSPYGEPFGVPAGDVDFDGWASPANASLISAWSSIPGWGYQAYADIDLDGDIDSADAGYTASDSMGWDVLSRDGSLIGSVGKAYSRLIKKFVLIHANTYDASLGRSIQRHSSSRLSIGRSTGAIFAPCYGPCCEVVVGNGTSLSECGPSEPISPEFGPADPPEPIDKETCCKRACNAAGGTTNGILTCCDGKFTQCLCDDNLRRRYREPCIFDSIRKCVAVHECRHYIDSCAGQLGGECGSDPGQTEPTVTDPEHQACTECRAYTEQLSCLHTANLLSQCQKCYPDNDKLYLECERDAERELRRLRREKADWCSRCVDEKRESPHPNPGIGNDPRISPVIDPDNPEAWCKCHTASD